MKKPTYYYDQSGVIPYRIKKNKMEVLLITSRNGNGWLMPKGIIDKGLEPAESALKEAFEEAGIIGNISETINWIFKYSKWEGVCEVIVYPMLVEKELDDYPEKDLRKKKWFSVKEATKKVKFKEVNEFILELEKLNKK